VETWPFLLSKISNSLGKTNFSRAAPWRKWQGPLSLSLRWEVGLFHETHKKSFYKEFGYARAKRKIHNSSSYFSVIIGRP
jgi:hypothetical protein